MSYTYVIERSAAQAVFQFSPRERRFLQAIFDQLAVSPFHTADFEEPGDEGRLLLTRYFGPFSITYWLDHAAKEVRIATIYRD